MELLSLVDKLFVNEAPNHAMRNFIKIFGIFLTLILMQDFAEAKTNMDMMYDSCDYNSSDPEGYVSQLNCYVSKNSKRRTFSIEMTFSKEIKEFYVNMLLILPRKSGDFVLLNLKNLTGCELLHNKNNVLFVRMLYATLGRFSNLPKECPFHVDTVYYIRNFRIDMSKMPAFSVETEMHMFFELVVHNNPIIKGFLKSHTYIKKTKGDGKQ